MSSGSTTEPFDVQVDDWVRKAGMRMQQAYDATVQDVVARLKELTPVRTGYLRANWIAVPAGQQSAVRGEAPLGFGLTDTRLGETMIIVNPVPYARRINFGFVGQDSLGRHYDQAGAHFVEKVIAELPQIARAATQRVIDGGQA